MPVCPVCENAQAGGEACEVCGRPLAAPDTAAAEAAVSPMPDLEVTRHAPAAELAAEAFAELEPNALPAAADDPPASDAFAGLEPNALPAAPDVPVAFGAGVCRYCRTPLAGSEPFCLGCGTRLPRARARSGAAAAAGAEHRVCSGCGLPLVGTRCAGCGTRAPRP